MTGDTHIRSRQGLPELLERLGVPPQKWVLILSDVVALYLSGILVFALRSLWGPPPLGIYAVAMPLLLLGPMFSVFLGTCQAIALPPHKEVKQLFLATSMAYLVILTFLFLTKSGDAISRLVVSGAWACSIVAVPLLRGKVRRWLCRKPWWGRPLIFLQSGSQSDELRESLLQHPERGLTPVAVLDIPMDAGREVDAALLMERAAHIYPRAIGLLFLDSPCGQGAITPALLKEASLCFKSLLLVPSLTMGEHRLWLTPRDLAGAVGLLVRQNLLDTRRLHIKRIIDVLLTVIIGIVALPVGLLVAFAIRLDSPGPSLYHQERLGQGGRRFRIYKFRTMVRDAEEALENHLEENPCLRQQWETDQKLWKDPRITRMGAFLRKTSLDELPQLWNVMMGSMSLVGPRPIITQEVDRYGRVYEEYRLVKPGITGLWQVSGRNATSYAERVRLDHYYVNNWSVWMDLWILARTIPVVIRGNGAY